MGAKGFGLAGLARSALSYGYPSYLAAEYAISRESTPDGELTSSIEYGTYQTSEIMPPRVFG